MSGLKSLKNRGYGHVWFLYFKIVIENSFLKQKKIVFSENGNCFLNLMFHVLSLFSLLFLFFRTENDF